jgi:hypothetical protein
MLQINSFNLKKNRGTPLFVKAAPHNNNSATSWSWVSDQQQWAGTTSSMVDVVPIASLLLVLNGVRIKNEKWREHFENTISSKQSTTLIKRLDCKLCKKIGCDVPSAKTTVGRPAGAGMVWQHKLRSGGQTAAACGGSKELKSMRKPWQFTFSLWSQSSSSAGSQDNSHQGANLQVNDPVVQSSVERDEELRHYVQGHTLGGFDL